MIIRGKKLLGFLLFGIGMGILVGLGTWQFMRGLEKADIDRKLQQGESLVQVTGSPEDWSLMEYRQASLSGKWLTGREFLLENRIFQGRAGYEVLAPLTLSGDDSVVLVNRGWVAVEAVETVDLTLAGVAEPTGVLYRPDAGFTLGETVSGEETWPQTVLYLDMPALSRRLGLALAPVMLVLDPDQPASFQQLWRPTSIPASRHYGYAVQWWGLGLTLLVFGVIWRRRAQKRPIS